MDWAGGHRGEATRAFRYTTPSRKAHLPCLQTTLTPLTTLSLLGHPLTPVKKSIALGQCRPRNRVFSWTAIHFSTSRPRFRPFSWTATSSAAANADVRARGQAQKRQHLAMLSKISSFLEHAISFQLKRLLRTLPTISGIIVSSIDILCG